MTTILADHNVEGQALILWGALAAEGWLELFPLKLVTFSDVGLHFDSADKAVWHFAQENEMILLTDNRSMHEIDSLEQTIRNENTNASLPVLTIGNVARIDEKEYRERCITRLIEILLELDKFRGTGRIYIP